MVKVSCWCQSEHTCWCTCVSWTTQHIPTEKCYFIDILKHSLVTNSSKEKFVHGATFQFLVVGVKLRIINFRHTAISTQTKTKMPQNKETDWWASVLIGHHWCHLNWLPVAEERRLRQNSNEILYKNRDFFCQCAFETMFP